jgi:hypothetical protein
MVVTLLMTTWALIPWLDRNARRERPSPGFTDFGVAAILFLAFLNLKAMDIGGGGSEGGPLPDDAAVARACAWILLPVALGIAVLRVRVFGHRFFVFSGAALLHALLHGLGDLSYLLAGAIAAALAALATGFLTLRAGRRPPLPGEQD